MAHHPSLATRRRLLATAFVFLATGTAGAADLTGVWNGKWSCKGFDGEKYSAGDNKVAVLRITQVGDAISADLDDGNFLYSAVAIDDAKKPDEKAQAALVGCDTDPDPAANESELLLIKASAATDGSGKLKGKSFFEGNFEGGYLGTCKYKFERTSSADPAVISCLEGGD